MKFNVQLQAQLNNIESIAVPDSQEDPFEYTFKVSCVRCREKHPKEVIISRGESVDLKRSVATHNFYVKCSFCLNDGYVNILSAGGGTYTESGETKTMLELDTRGVVIDEFIPNGYFFAKSALSNQIFDEVELDEEWYDVDEKTMEEVSITDIKWTVV